MSGERAFLQEGGRGETVVKHEAFMVAFRRDEKAVDRFDATHAVVLPRGAAHLEFPFDLRIETEREAAERFMWVLHAVFVKGKTKRSEEYRKLVFDGVPFSEMKKILRDGLDKEGR